MRVYPTFFKLAFSWMDAEKAHKIGFQAIRAAHRTGAGRVLARITAPDASLRTEAFGLTFPSPFGLAAGFDKEGHGIEALADLGFGHVEVGTITGQAQPGNEKPRLFRLIEDRAVINRMGFNNDGAAAVAPRLKSAKAALQRLHADVRPVIGVNIGKTKVVELDEATEDYLVSARSLAPAADYLVVNVSSPNTPGLRLLQNVETLRPLLRAVGDAADEAAGRHVPLLVKIAPDLSNEDIDDVARLALDLKLDGIIATNTTIARDGLVTDAAKVGSLGAGGLSGAPLKQRSLEVLRRLKDAVGDQLVLIAVGGVESAQDVQDRLNAGATLVQGYTAFLYEGPFWASRINKGLVKIRKRGALV
ncbi:quinone-dependent dihydroorotate dehydrogenase [Paenarthrobacter aromaticivorans]|uniref:Dihydroorotate dehydrogenase (quinone) n=1 Tax=Paenarthrobacter aromaticivorans TaxID=2849150 RepID=A0ABS6I701_9MICC|nr:quinone-dependent dihydroorotate dehydrogenase [Paenarthrobacter sp. MMS21-TAE1-1]MBU8867491.1 quinone-dependent dihydroorotate dehydrogenase [Paenarthrobacter sp. MMS21-TAE1-1]